jgi:hypothetical protein
MAENNIDITDETNERTEKNMKHDSTSENHNWLHLLSVGQKPFLHLINWVHTILFVTGTVSVSGLFIF